MVFKRGYLSKIALSLSVLKYANSYYLYLITGIKM
jgi:hypothetical protein